MDEFKKILDSLRAKSTEAGDGDDGPPVEIDREAAKFQELLERVRENMKAEDEARKWDEAKARYDPKDLYQILGISPREVNADRVRAAYHRVRHRPPRPLSSSLVDDVACGRSHLCH
mmetsp:Transcript_19028/g.36620  ORF Transcript_19028/g.36620 Transcript_19028/m.36620 type:complete len:117 (-) Transcript_19028:36-386(-)